MKTNLIVVFYFGPKRRDVFFEKINPLICLEQQVKHLLKYKHNLDQITFVVNGTIPEGYDKIVEPLSQKFNLVTVRRENIGISYGGFAEVATKYLDDFDFFIFLEDDWFFRQDNFDSYLIEKFNQNPNTSMVCAVSSKKLSFNSWKKDHAAVSVYCSSQKQIKKLIDKRGHFPFSYRGYDAGQVHQTSAFFEIGEVVDITDDFFVKFLDHRGTQSWGDPENGELLLQLDFLENFD